jgi:hypothetical protein
MASLLANLSASLFRTLVTGVGFSVLTADGVVDLDVVDIFSSQFPDQSRSKPFILDICLRVGWPWREDSGPDMADACGWHVIKYLFENIKFMQERQNVDSC